MTLFSHAPRPATTLLMPLVTLVITVALGVPLPASAQGIGATGKQRILVVPIQRSEGVSSVVPGRVDEYIRTLLEMSGKIEVVGMTGLVDKPTKKVATPVVTDKDLVKADETLWKAKEAAEKGAYGKAIQLFKRSAKLYEKRFDKLVDFDKYVDAALGVSLSYFLAGYEDNGEDALAPVVVLRPDIMLDRRKVPKTAIAAMDRLTRLYEGGTKGEVKILSKPPGAEVFIDGNRVGTTPHTVSRLHRGRHVARIVQPGHQPWAKTFNAGARKQTLKARLKPISRASSKGPKKVTVRPQALIAAAAKGTLHKGFGRIAKPVAERYNLDAIVLFYIRHTPTHFELAPFLFDRAANRLAELEWIHLDHSLTNMQVNLLVLDEKLNAALANFPMSRVMRRKSGIYKIIKAPKPVVVAPKPKPKPVVVVPKPKPKPVVVVPKRKPRPRARRKRIIAPTPKPVVVMPQPAYVPPAPAASPSFSAQVDDGLGGNLGTYPYPGSIQPSMALSSVHAPPPPPPLTPTPISLPTTSDVTTFDEMPDTMGNAWYEEWWVWTIVGAAVAGGTTAALWQYIDTEGGDGYGGTVQW